MTHPTLDEIDAVRTGEAAPAIVEHIASCDACQVALADLQVVGSELRLSRRSTPVPESVDQRILWLARKQALSIRRGKRTALAPLSRWAIAASILIAIGVIGLWQRAQQHLRPSRITREAMSPRDLNDDGRVDILDAFALARAVEAGRSVDSALDLDKDGRVSRDDVDLLAQFAVALGNS